MIHCVCCAWEWDNGISITKKISAHAQKVRSNEPEGNQHTVEEKCLAFQMGNTILPWHFGNDADVGGLDIRLYRICPVGQQYPALSVVSWCLMLWKDISEIETHAVFTLNDPQREFQVCLNLLQQLILKRDSTWFNPPKIFQTLKHMLVLH